MRPGLAPFLFVSRAIVANNANTVCPELAPVPIPIRASNVPAERGTTTQHR
eukprot:COSAG06_NODE_11035_length_1578_cov_1.734956_3_plen_50_part_01